MFLFCCHFFYMAIIKQDVNKWRKYTTYRKKLFEVCFILALFPEKWGHFVTDSPRTYHHSAVNLKLTTFSSLVLSNFNEEITNELSTRHWLSAAKAPEIVHWIGTSFLISWALVIYILQQLSSLTTTRLQYLSPSLLISN